MNILGQRNLNFRKSHKRVEGQKLLVPLVHLFAFIRTLVIVAIVGVILYFLYPTLKEWFQVFTKTIE